MCIILNAKTEKNFFREFLVELPKSATKRSKTSSAEMYLYKLCVKEGESETNSYFYLPASQM
jgi:hypothetical protein